jgi:hypothetical protein
MDVVRGDPPFGDQIDGGAGRRLEASPPSRAWGNILPLKLRMGSLRWYHLTPQEPDHFFEALFWLQAPTASVA